MELTDRQAEILSLVASGLTNRQIGQKIWLTENTVKTHMRRIFRSLGVSSRADAVAVATQRGLI